MSPDPRLASLASSIFHPHPLTLSPCLSFSHQSQTSGTEFEQKINSLLTGPLLWNFGVLVLYCNSNISFGSCYSCVNIFVCFDDLHLLTTRRKARVVLKKKKKKKKENRAAAYLCFGNLCFVSKAVLMPFPLSLACAPISSLSDHWLRLRLCRVCQQRLPGRASSFALA